MEESSEIKSNFRLKEWFPELDEKSLSQLKLFFDYITKTNKTLNLISVKTFPLLDLIHFSDSIIASNIISSNLTNNFPLYDIGSGNGFPGIVFAILNPSKSVIFVENDKAKQDFLRSSIQLLQLKNASVLNDSIESIKDSQIYNAVSRGFLNIPKCILLLRKQFVKGGVYFHLKTDEWGMEVTQIPPQLCSIWNTSLVSSYKLPVGSMLFSVVRSDKL